MTGVVVAAVVGVSAASALTGPIASATLGFDNEGPNSQATLACLAAHGFRFDLVDEATTGWQSEVQAAKTIGMVYSLVQGYEVSAWEDVDNGTSRGQQMASDAASVGYPAGSDVFLDLESDTNASESSIFAWVENWANAVKARGYVAGVYVGLPQVLTSSDLNGELPDVGVYWRSESLSAPTTSHGYVAVQSPDGGSSVCGARVDEDTAGTDSAGHGLLASAGGGSVSSRVQTAFEANTKLLWTTGSLPGGKTTLGMMAGTSPSITAVSGGYQIAFQANTSDLWTVGSLPGGNAQLGMKAGTSPSITAVGSGVQVAFQANTGLLWTAGSTGSKNWKLGMMAGTSPSITAVSGGYQIAFQANTSDLWTVGSLPGGDALLSMRAGSSPSIAAV